MPSWINKLGGKVDGGLLRLGKGAFHLVTGEENLAGLKAAFPKRPVETMLRLGAAGVGASMVAGPILRPIKKNILEPAFSESGMSQEEELGRQLVEEEERQANMQAARDDRAQRLARQRDYNLSILRQMAPDLYARVQVGRRVPRGAVVIGGRQRNDLLRLMGDAMAEGRFKGVESYSFGKGGPTLRVPMDSGTGMMGA